MPPKGAAALSEASGTLQRVGGDAVEHVRNRTFHYPQPHASYSTDEELAQVLKALSEHEATFRIDRTETPPAIRLEFADEAANRLAFGKHHKDDDGLREQAEETLRGSTSFIGFVNYLMVLYMEERDLNPGEATPL